MHLMRPLGVKLGYRTGELVNHQEPNVVDLFSGCGGMSWGLSKAGFNIVGAVDDWEIALETFAYNMPTAKVFACDIRTLSVSNFLQELGLAASEIDVVIGGPPCQGFSKNTPAALRFLDDPRNQLFREFMRFVDEIRPKVVIMENVAEIFNAYGGRVRDEIAETFTRLGYQVDIRVHNAADYGVPQKRRRCFFFASLASSAPKFPSATHIANGDRALFDRAVAPSAWEAIMDLPSPISVSTQSVEYEVDAKTELQRWLRGDSTTVANHVERRLSPIQLARYRSIEPGQAIRDLPDELRPKSGYSGAYGRLDFTSQSPTITRWVFHPGSGRYGHPVLPRSITMREAARLQSFTDDFEFKGSNTEIAGQIGNAVPPLLINRFAEQIRESIKEFQLEGQEAV
jgi:DNA (cytosine-5)-methyltransferase 1